LQEITEHVETADKKIKRLRDKINSLKTRTEIYHTERFDDGPWLFQWYGTSDVYYPSTKRDILYSNYTKDLDADTMQKSVSNKHTFDIHLVLWWN
jgi:hypothetical protein